MAVGSKWHEKLISAGDRQKIEQAVVHWETKTSGEIIPMIVKSSTDIAYVPTILGLVLSILAMPIFFELYILTNSLAYLYVMPFALLLLFLLANFLGRFAWAQRLATFRKEQILDVHTRAEMEFYRGRFNHTKKQTGVLIFLSLLEHRAVVLGDRAISAKLSAEDWNEVVQALTEQAKKGDLAGGMLVAIEKVGAQLAKHFPASGSNPDELGNHLIIKE